MKTKWFHSATAMALIAILALFVSPALAFGCCCGTPTIHGVEQIGSSHHADEVEIPAHSCCSEDAPHGTAHESSAANHAANDCPVIEKVCECTTTALDLPFVSADNAHFSVFAPAIAALPQQQFVFTYVEDVRTAAYINHAARPRSPSLSVAAGRAPPALAQS